MSLRPSTFNTLQNTVISLIITKGVSWGMTVTEVSDIVAYRTTYSPLVTAAKEKMTKSKATTLARNENQALYLPALVKVFDKHLINNNAISAVDKAAMGIHEMATPGSPIPNPTKSPLVNITHGASLQHIVNMRNGDTNRIGKPAGVGFMEMWYKIDGPEPTGLDDTTEKVNIGSTGDAITFILAQKGKTVYYFARWVTRNGGYGPWGDWFSAVIA